MDAAAKAEATRIATGTKRLSYPDYESGADLPLWMQGLREKTRIAFGYTHAQGAQISADIVKIISGKLKSGAPLDTYNGLMDAEKSDYDQMVSRLTEEFLDRDGGRDRLSRILRAQTIRRQSRAVLALEGFRKGPGPQGVSP